MTTTERPTHSLPMSVIESGWLDVDGSGWELRSACRGLDHESFTPDAYANPENDDGIRMAQQVCKNCDVRPQCRATALALAAPVGVWDGVFIPYSNNGTRRRDRALAELAARHRAAS